MVRLSGDFKVVEVKKKTQAVFFKDLKVGDKFQLTYDLSGMYESAPVVNIHKDGKYAHSSKALQLSKNLQNFTVIRMV